MTETECQIETVGHDERKIFALLIAKKQQKSFFLLDKRTKNRRYVGTGEG